MRGGEGTREGEIEKHAHTHTPRTYLVPIVLPHEHVVALHHAVTEQPRVHLHVIPLLDVNHPPDVLRGRLCVCERECVCVFGFQWVLDIISMDEKIIYMHSRERCLC